MEYYELLGLKLEPFMDTADPYFLYQSASHRECLHRLEISLRLGRGLNLVLGDVGTGKTTLAQALEQTLMNEEQFLLGKLLDPTFSSESQFLENIRMIFNIDGRASGSLLAAKNLVKNFLFRAGVEETRTVVLLIDEGQKLTSVYLETLRMLLNYQTPQKKLLNIVIFGQLELLSEIQQKPNFTDRISVFHILVPLTRDETHKMIDFRLARAGLPEGRELFTTEAKDFIFRETHGRPRKITLLCHEALEQLIVLNRNVVTEELLTGILARTKQTAAVAVGAGESVESGGNSSKPGFSLMKWLGRR
ncbi:MAG: AAA family ATPase [Armatimonadetes bacterium]|nr:AAA family ATPase [Armatimonadota bacterium]